MKPKSKPKSIKGVKAWSVVNPNNSLADHIFREKRMAFAFKGLSEAKIVRVLITPIIKRRK